MHFLRFTVSFIFLEHIFASIAISSGSLADIVSSEDYEIYAPTIHEALTRPLFIQWTNSGPEDGRKLIVELEPIGQTSRNFSSSSSNSESNELNESKMSTVGTRGCGKVVQHSNVEFGCECGNAPGQWHVLLKDFETNRLLAASEPINVIWPEIFMTTPTEVTALSGVTDVNFHIESPLCHNNISTKVQLAYSADGLGFGRSSVEVWKGNIWELTNLSVSCNHIQLAGFYKVELLVETSPVPVAVSSVIKANWYSYNLTMMQDTIYPCQGLGSAFGVVFNGPSASCRSDAQVRIRLYALLDKQNNPLYKPWALEYQAERRVGTDLTYPRVDFPCSLFDQIYPAYCFVLVTVSSGGRVTRHLQKCIRTKKRSRPIIAVWSGWSGWGGCTVTCGHGVSHRHRKCQINMARSAGQFLCEGPTTSTKACFPAQCPVTEINPFIKTPQVQTSVICECGCQLNSPGLLVLSTRCSNDSIWTILAPEDHHVKLKLIKRDTTLNSILLRIRDGVSTTDALLFDNSGSVNCEVRAVDSFLDQPLISHQNGLRVELSTSYDHCEDEMRVSGTSDNVAMIFAIEFIDDHRYKISTNTFSGTKITETNDHSWPFWVWLLLIGVSAGVTLLILIIAAIAFHRFTRRKLKRKLQLIMSDSMQSTGSEGGRSVGLGKYYDPFKVGNRQSAYSDQSVPASPKYQRISAGRSGSDRCSPPTMKITTKIAIGGLCGGGLGGRMDESCSSNSSGTSTLSSTGSQSHGPTASGLNLHNSTQNGKLSGEDVPSQHGGTSNHTGHSHSSGRSPTIPVQRVTAIIEPSYHSKSATAKNGSRKGTGSAKDPSLQPLLGQPGTTTSHCQAGTAVCNGVKSKFPLQDIPEEVPGDGLSPTADIGLDSARSSFSTATNPSSGEKQQTKPYFGGLPNNNPLRSEISPSPQLHPKQRSIGIQLNSPHAPGLRRQASLASSLRSSLATLGPQSGRTSPMSADYEYDYYEPDWVPGSFFNPDAALIGGFIDDEVGSLNIDDIIAGSELMKDFDDNNESAKTPVPPKKTEDESDEMNK